MLVKAKSNKVSTWQSFKKAILITGIDNLTVNHYKAGPFNQETVALISGDHVRVYQSAKSLNRDNLIPWIDSRIDSLKE